MEATAARTAAPPEWGIDQRAEALYLSLTPEEREKVNRYLDAIRGTSCILPPALFARD